MRAAPSASCRRAHHTREPCSLTARATFPAMRSALFLVALVAAPAFAQEDDDLPALPSAKPKPGRPKPAKKPPAKKPPAPPPVAADDDLPALPAQKGELLVKL